MSHPPRRSRQRKKAVLAPVGTIGRDELEQMAETAGYRPSPYHKSRRTASVHPVPHPDKTVCDGPGPFDCRDAADLLKSGFLRGMISAQTRPGRSRNAGWPQNVWAVDDNGIVYEAQLENPELGEYHGYPMKVDDPFTDHVRRAWKGRS